MIHDWPPAAVVRRCRVEPGGATTVCGRPIRATGVVRNGPPSAMTCPDCWQALPFLRGG